MPSKDARVHAFPTIEQSLTLRYVTACGIAGNEETAPIVNLSREFDKMTCVGCRTITEERLKREGVI